MSKSGGTWRAGLSDGRQFCEASPELANEERSAWRQLERLCLEQGIQIAWAEAEKGYVQVRLEAEGCPMVSGQTVHITMPLDGGPQKQVWFRWVCRQGKRAWFWRITDGEQAWEIETTPGIPGEEHMPSPEASPDVGQ